MLKDPDSPVPSPLLGDHTAAFVFPGQRLPQAVNNLRNFSFSPGGEAAKSSEPGVNSTVRLIS